MNRVPVFLKWLAASVAAVAVFTLALVIKGGGTATPLPAGITASPTVSATPAPANITSLIIQVTDENWNVQGIAFYAHNSALTELRIANVDPQATFDSGNAGYSSIYTAGTLAPLSSVTERLSVATGTRADATLILQRLALAGLIDSVGGIDITSADDYPVSSGPGPILYVTKGTAHVDGTRAAGYAVISQPGDTPKKHMARMNQVLLAVLNKLPSDPNRLNEVLLSLGQLARSTMPMTDINRFIVDLHDHGLFANPVTYVVPTSPSDLGELGQADWRRIRLASAAQLAAMGGVDLTPIPVAGHINVLVSSSVPNDRLSLRKAIVKAGVNFVDGGPTALVRTTVVRIGPAVSLRQQSDLEKELGLAQATVVRDSTVSGFADVEIVLGLDYRAKEKLTGSVN